VEDDGALILRPGDMSLLLAGYITTSPSVQLHDVRTLWYPSEETDSQYWMATVVTVFMEASEVKKSMYYYGADDHKVSL
jgi:hypothetical protein